MRIGRHHEPRREPYDGAAVVIPAHDERDNLPRCLNAVLAAASALAIPTRVIAVLDTCTDGSGELRKLYGSEVEFVDVDAKNVGASRAAGFARARALEGSDGASWYATTDADSRVDADWLVRQLDADADMVLGVVRVANWRNASAATVNRYLTAYRAKSRRRGSAHGHVHGANMGFSAESYWALGGFADLASGEDVDLVRRFEVAGRRIHRDAGLIVETSARSEGRAPRGFASYLRSMAHTGAA